MDTNFMRSVTVLILPLVLGIAQCFGINSSAQNDILN